jgi:hypothetical protein
MDFVPSISGPSVWMRPASKANGFEYFEYLLVYVEDVLILSHNPDPILKCIEGSYRLKESATETKMCLGAWAIEGDSGKIWSMSSSHYIKEAITNLERHLLFQKAYDYRENHKPL